MRPTVYIHPGDHVSVSFQIGTIMHSTDGRAYSVPAVSQLTSSSLIRCRGDYKSGSRVAIGDSARRCCRPTRVSDISKCVRSMQPTSRRLPGGRIRLRLIIDPWPSFVSGGSDWFCARWRMRGRCPAMTASQARKRSIDGRTCVYASNREQFEC